jgi:hypothetical protein
MCVRKVRRFRFGEGLLGRTGISISVEGTASTTTKNNNINGTTNTNSQNNTTTGYNNTNGSGTFSVGGAVTSTFTVNVTGCGKKRNGNGKVMSFGITFSLQ